MYARDFFEPSHRAATSPHPHQDLSPLFSSTSARLNWQSLSFDTFSQNTWSRGATPGFNHERGCLDSFSEFETYDFKLLARCSHAAPTVVVGGKDEPIGPVGGIFATTGCSLRYSASEMAPMPHSSTASPAQTPTHGKLVTTRTRMTPSAMRPTKGQSSVVRPIIHVPTIEPTTTSALRNATIHIMKVEIPTSRPTTVIHAMIAAMKIPGSTSTPNPNAAPRCSAASTVSTANRGIRLNSTSPNRMNAAVQMARH